MPDDRTPRAAANQRKWREASNARFDHHPRSGAGRTVFYYGLTLAAIAGAVVALFLYLSRSGKPYFLALAVTEYHSPLFPYNAYAQHDSDELRKCFAGEEGFTTQERQLFVNELNKLKDRKEKTIVLYVRAYGVGRGEKVFILLADAQPNDESTWYALDDALAAISRCPAENKLLLLDLMQPIADARLGIIADDTAVRVHEALANIADPNLQVFCACAPGQTSRIAPALGQSVFGYYLRQGLNGAADGYDEKNERNNQVSVDELTAYVRARVDRWAHDRNSRQTPVLKGNAKDFKLTTYDQLPTVAESVPALPYRENEWKARDEWCAHGYDRLLPGSYGQLRESLLRAEQWRAGGKEVDAPLAKFETMLHPRDADVRDFLKRFIKPTAAASETPKPTDGKNSEPPPVPLRRRLARVVETLPTRDEKKEDKDADAAVKSVNELLEKDPEAVSRAITDVLVFDVKPNAQVLRWFGKLVESYTKPNAPRGISLTKQLTHSGSNLCRLDAQFWPNQPAERGVQFAFQAVQRADELDAFDAGVLRWIQPETDRAVAEFKEGVKRLCDAKESGTREQAEKSLEAAANAYTRALASAKTIREAEAAADQALAWLPDYPRFLLKSAEQRPEDWTDWREAVALAARMDDLLLNPRGAQNSVDELRQRIVQLSEISERLTTGFQRGIKRLFQESAVQDSMANPGRSVALRAVLSTPFTTAAERKELWDAWRREELRLQELTMAKDQSDDAQTTKTSPPDDADRDAKTWTIQELERARLRAEYSLRLWQLGGLTAVSIPDVQGRLEATPIADLSQEIDAAYREALANSRLQAFDPVAVKLAKVWANLSTLALTEKQVARQVRLSRILAFAESNAGTGVEIDPFLLVRLRLGKPDLLKKSAE